MILVGAMFVCAHYIQQLDISRLTIQKHMIKKQQQQLNVFFQSQKDGIIIYELEEETPTSSNSNVESRTGTYPILLQNDAVESVTGIKRELSSNISTLQSQLEKENFLIQTEPPDLISQEAGLGGYGVPSVTRHSMKYLMNKAKN